jgi:hypothetical protein
MSLATSLQPVGFAIKPATGPGGAHAGAVCRARDPASSGRALASARTIESIDAPDALDDRISPTLIVSHLARASDVSPSLREICGNLS